MKERSVYLGGSKRDILLIKQLNVYDPPIEILWNKLSESWIPHKQNRFV